MDTNDFNQIYEILSSSFEEHFHRGYERQKSLLNEDMYNIITYKKDNKVLGFLSYWELEKNLIFIEHFAVSKDLRGTGIGKKIFKDIINMNGIKILEVEPPISEIDIKRIKFYESFGFVLNENEYYQPSYNKDKNKFKLKIMCSEQISNEQFNKIVSIIKKIVYCETI